jgi:hypothetical protein
MATPFNPAAIPALPASEARDIRLPAAEEECLLRHAKADSLGWLDLPIMLMLEVNLRRGELLKAKRHALSVAHQGRRSLGVVP